MQSTPDRLLFIGQRQPCAAHTFLLFHKNCSTRSRLGCKKLILIYNQLSLNLPGLKLSLATSVRIRVMKDNLTNRVIIIGAGPAGLTAAYKLCQAGLKPIVLEKERAVGGLSKTVSFNDHRLDLGGHRFFTKVRAVDEMWREVLDQADFLRRQRLSRIYYHHQFFHYPLQLFNVITGLGLMESLLILVSYLRAFIFPVMPERTFEQWVTNRFGRRMFETFFKTYTEKVWGIPCDEISAEWAEQRIQGLSLWVAVREALWHMGPSAAQPRIKSLIKEFDYPKYGPGMMWEAVADLVASGGGELVLGAGITRIILEGHRVTAVEVTINNQLELLVGDHFISSMPVRELIAKFDPPAPPEVQHAALHLEYRDFIVVGLILDQKDVFPDNWVYVHGPEVKVGRIQNFANWSPGMVGNPEQTCLGMEYFCNEGDDLWSLSDQQLVTLATKELEQIGLAPSIHVLDGAVFRVPKAYPVYNSTHRHFMREIRNFTKGIENLQLVGRNGMHQYNNQDHSMLTAMLAVQNILGAEIDLWSIDMESQYQEQVNQGEAEHWNSVSRLASAQPIAPKRI